MKRLLILLTATSIFMACSDEKKKDDKTSDDKKDSKMSDVNLPYTADYSNFKIGDPNNTKLVLDFYKAFEENRMDAGKVMLADSVKVNFADGNKFNGTADSLITLGKQFRSGYSEYTVTIDACMSVHENDKKEDWVLIWERVYSTDQKGKSDSLGGHSYWQIKNGKIAFWGEQQAKLAASSAMK